MAKIAKIVRRTWTSALATSPSVCLALFATACATAPTVTSERRAEISAAAQSCLREHPTIERYEVNRFGYVIATYRTTQSQTADTAPFFVCVRARLGQPTPAVAAPTAPMTGTSLATLPPRVPMSPPSSGRWPAALPLPDDVVVRPPAPCVILELQAFLWGSKNFGQGKAVISSLVEKKVLSRSPDGRLVKLTDYGLECRFSAGWDPGCSEAWDLWVLVPHVTVFRAGLGRGGRPQDGCTSGARAMQRLSSPVGRRARRGEGLRASESAS